uniref:Uncharacterized protein n=1 Tax=Wuchereria bancrofti TaxID=6293 RepID=A0AAF5Q1A6_WUCBA
MQLNSVEVYGFIESVRKSVMKKVMDDRSILKYFKSGYSTFYFVISKKKKKLELNE